MTNTISQQQDLRDTCIYQDIESLYRSIRRPGEEFISEANSLHVSPSGQQLVFVGTVVNDVEGLPATRVCITDLGNGATRTVADEISSVRSPLFSPDGTCIALLSDQHSAGDFQLVLYDLRSGATTAGPRVDGWVEYLQWSADGHQLLLGVAGHGADVAGAQGAATSQRRQGVELPSWLPRVETGDEDYCWRSVWLYTPGADQPRQASRNGSNVWEAVWCGPNTIAAIVSPTPGEAAWYTAALHLIDTVSGDERVLYTAGDQLGGLSASPSGYSVAVIEALCSDRGIVAGELLVIDTITAAVKRVDTNAVDISCTQWRSEKRLLMAGQRDFETVISEYNRGTAVLSETWASQEISTSGFYASVVALGDGVGECVLAGEGFYRAPEIALIRDGRYLPVVSFDKDYNDIAKAHIDTARAVKWRAPDGLDIHGWLLTPKGNGPFPLVLSVHGGPVWQFRPRWLGRAISTLMLIKRGYAVLQSNPRGSSGRGADFARRVYGDMGGAEIDDHLSGIDALVRQGVADPARLGVMGGSHGGFIASHIITRDQRFAAAVPMSPVTDWVSQHLTSNIPYFDALVLAAEYNAANSHYVERSPIMHAHKVQTPTLHLCGAKDRCTPPGQAQEYHNALLAHGVISVLVTYPEEGHGVRQLPTAIDYAARVVAWFEHYMPV